MGRWYQSWGGAGKKYYQMTALNDIGYSGPLAYECAPPSTPDLHERVRLLDENIRWLESLA